MLSEIKEQWTLDDSGNVTYQKILELPELSKDIIYPRSLNFFSYNLENEPLSLTEDRELGMLLVKGVFDRVHSTGVFLDYTHIHCLNLIRIDVKDEKARILVTLSAYEIESGNVGEDDLPLISSSKVNQEFPINPSGRNKTMMGKAFYKSHMRAISLMDKISNALENGNTSPSLEDRDW
ncbi:uncharacterized protein with TBP-like fold DUF4468 [Flagellimonas meridianipacifica]|uniref:Uncharacterized protein with TBP-like fold DUF4468 n=2 Tax=Flagellimonas meridianipacifica TaxID=1080225 RepID=A0A2T0MAQ0_9FLAO|nr:uncharacterized protein with TBP-like fold DUF4468 [Allomuricauda pacifica]